jgi:hypothetical protein
MRSTRPQSFWKKLQELKGLEKISKNSGAYSLAEVRTRVRRCRKFRLKFLRQCFRYEIAAELTKGSLKKNSNFGLETGYQDERPRQCRIWLESGIGQLVREIDHRRCVLSGCRRPKAAISEERSAIDRVARSGESGRIDWRKENLRYLTIFFLFFRSCPVLPFDGEPRQKESERGIGWSGGEYGEITMNLHLEVAIEYQ